MTAGTVLPAPLASHRGDGEGRKGMTEKGPA